MTPSGLPAAARAFVLSPLKQERHYGPVDDGWSGYEDSNGNDLTDIGGTDATIQFDLTLEALGDPFVIEAGTSSAWHDPTREGEGFMLEILSGSRAVMYWFTYDMDGNQDWYIAEGEIRGNRILFPELVHVSGGEFGPGFDSENVSETIKDMGGTIHSIDEVVAGKEIIDDAETLQD